MKVDCIEIQAGESKAGLLARLNASPSPYIVLKLPASYPLLADPMQMRALRQAADRVHKAVAVVTDEAEIWQAARQSGVPRFLSCDLARSLPWLATRWPDLPKRPLSAAVDILPEKRVHGWVERQLRRTWRIKRPWNILWQRLWHGDIWLLRVRLLLVALLVGIILPLVWHGYVDWLPSADIYLVAAHQPIQAQVDLYASPAVGQVNVLGGAIPARYVEAMMTDSIAVPTTGKRWVPSGKAAGQVVFTNKLINEVPIPAGTIVSTGTGQAVRFRTMEDAVLPPGVGAQVTVPVQAETEGPTGNVAAYAITRLGTLLSLQVLVINPEPTKGGGWKKVAVVTDADKEKAHNEIVRVLGQKAFAVLTQKQHQGEEIPLETVRTYVMAETFDHFRGDQTNKLTVKMRMLVRGVAIDITAAQQVAYQALLHQLPPAARLFSLHLRYERGPISAFDTSSSSVYFSMRAAGVMAVGADPHLVRQQVMGKSIQEATKILQASWALAAPPQIVIGPSWLKGLPGWLQPGGGRRLPRTAGRIRVTVDLGGTQ